jgi:hypothetical protein
LTNIQNSEWLRHLCSGTSASARGRVALAQGGAQLRHLWSGTSGPAHLDYYPCKNPPLVSRPSIVPLFVPSMFIASARNLEFVVFICFNVDFMDDFKVEINIAELFSK